MIKLLKIEWFKLRKHRFFWIGMGLFLVCMALLLIEVGGISLSQNQSEEGYSGTVSSSPSSTMLTSLGEMGFYKLPYVWQNTTYLAGFFKFIPAFLLMFFTANEFQYRTMRQNIIDGLSLRQFYFSKVYSLIGLALISTLAVGLVTAGLILTSSQPEGSFFWEQSVYLVALFGEYICLMALALLFTVLFKRSAVSIILLLLYYVIVEPIIGFSIGEPVASYLPTEPSRSLIQQPFTRMMKVDGFLGLQSTDTIPPFKLIATFLYTIIFSVAGYWVLKRRDI